MGPQAADGATQAPLLAAGINQCCCSLSGPLADVCRFSHRTEGLNSDCWSHQSLPQKDVFRSVAEETLVQVHQTTKADQKEPFVCRSGKTVKLNQDKRIEKRKNVDYRLMISQKMKLFLPVIITDK